MEPIDPAEAARLIFLEDEGLYGCAETALIALQRHYRLPDPDESAPAMALNGGIAYSGGMCGALTGAALAVGSLTASRIDDHRRAKRASRLLIQRVMTGFHEAFGATDCRTLTGYDMVADHDAFMADGSWKVDCTKRIQFVVSRLAALRDEGPWDETVRSLEPAASADPQTTS